MTGPDSAPAPFVGADRSDSFWKSLLYFSIYRATVALVFVLAAVYFGDMINLGSQNTRLFRWVGVSYLVAAVVFLWSVARVKRAFDLQLSLQVGCDVLALTLLMYASGGSKSGIEVMIFVVLAGAGLVGQGRLTLFYAALATLAVLSEQAYRVAYHRGDIGEFFRTGLASTGFFGTAIVARLLARRVVANENLARQRGAELASQLQLNQRVIRDMQDGVLVADAEGRIRQHNLQAEILFGKTASAFSDLDRLSPELALRYREWRQAPVDAEAVLRVEETRRTLHVRLLPPGDGDLALIYLEDMGRIQAQAQQIKLAALGRLTANMAHEIRNPLSAISHASELLAEDADPQVQRRLVAIIGDNTRRLNRLVAEVLELGRRDRTHPEDIELAAFFSQFLEEWRVHDPAAAVRILSDIQPGLCLRFDRSHLHRVLTNLVGNALRHASSSPGAVRIEAVPLGDRGAVEVHIVDDGPGIDESLRSQVFEPFFTTHAGGTGLGLYIARELCEANDARLDLIADGPAAHFRISGKGGTWSAGVANGEN